MDSFSLGKVTGAIMFDTRRAKKGELYPIKYRVTFSRQRKYFDTGFSLSVADWNSLPHTKNSKLKEARELLTNGNSVIRQHIKDLVSANNFSFASLQSRLKKGDNTSVNAAFAEKIKDLASNGQVGTATIYGSALKSLSDFNKGREMRFLSLTPEWLRKYEQWFIGESVNSYATASIYFRCLRAIFNEAISNGIISNVVYPFGRGKYEIPSSPGRNLALSLPQIKTLIEYPLEPGSTSEKMRDLWFFIYLANGMNIKDLVSLKWKNINNGEIVYYLKSAREKFGLKADFF